MWNRDHNKGELGQLKSPLNYGLEQTNFNENTLIIGTRSASLNQTENPGSKR